ncbi:MAG TPA: hypothetical protein VJ990_08505 [Clostridia bacterium]|nr:hypothetical protein [Clostridia bacterium]
MNKKQKQNIIGLIVLAVASSILGRFGSAIHPYVGYLGSGFALAFALLAFINVSRSGRG